MRKLRALMWRLRGTVWRSRREREIEAEFESHLQLHTDDNIRAGMTPGEAERAARLRLGNLTALREEYRERAGLPWLDTAARDVKYALRTFRQSPSFTLIVILTIGLGIGATTAMFGVLQAVLLRPLPYGEPDRLVHIGETNPLKHWTDEVASPANFADWRRLNRVFTDVAAYASGGAFLTAGGEPRRIQALRSTGNLFDVLEVKPLLGRPFQFEETMAGRDRVVILSYGFWKTAFGRDPGIVGRSVQINDKNLEVIGVAPRGFYFPTRDIEVYLPLGLQPKLFTEMRRPHWLRVVARLKPGLRLEEARDQMKAIAARLEQTYPGTNTKMGVRLEDYHANLSAQKRPALVMLFAAVVVLFLIVCSNVANLQLGRSAVRARELNIRQALGAGRARIIRQLLTESFLLSFMGGAIGLALALAARMAVARFAPQAIPPFADLQFDRWTIAFSMAMTVFAPLLFALLPAARAASPEMVRERSEATVQGGRLRTVLIAIEVALAVVLAVSATLLTRSLLRLESVPPGFRADSAITFRLTFPSSRYPKDEDAVRAVERLERNLKSQPGVSAVGVSLSLPLSPFAWSGDATPEGRAGDDYERELRHNSVTPGYFAAIGTPLLDGRLFDQHDGNSSQPVTIVNQALEKKYFRGQKAVGKRIKFGRPSDSDPWTIVVGVIADQKQDGLDTPSKPEAFVPFATQPNDEIYVSVRGDAAPDILFSNAQAAVKALDPNLVLTGRQLLRDLVAKSDSDQRFRTSLLISFAVIAVFLAALGVYGVLAYSIAQRTREIGIRLALGARSREIYRLVLASGFRPVLIGAVVGIAAALGATRLLVSLLFEVAPADPVTYIVTVLIVMVTALAACSLPAWRAIRIDPLACLREQ